MRTTLDLDPAVLNVARDIAAHSQRSLGAVISELARQGLASRSARASKGSRNGFPLFTVPPGTAPVTSETVKQLLADEDMPA